MGGQADEIGADCNNIDRDLAGGLHRVAMEQGAMAMRDIGDIGNRLDRAGFVVREHHRNQGGTRIGSEQLFESPQIDNTVRADGNTLGMLQGLQHRAVLNRRDNNSLATAAEKR